MVTNSKVFGRKGFEQVIEGRGFGKSFKKQHSKPNYGKSNNYNNNFTRGGPGMIKRGSHKPKYGHNGSGDHSNGAIVRNPISKSTIEMRDKADKWKNIIDHTDKEDIEKKAKALLNKITPDNYKKLRDQVFDVMNSVYSKIRDLPSDDPNYSIYEADCFKFIKVFFKKAILEDRYVSTYTNLLRFILDKEYDLTHSSPSPTASPSKSEKPKKKKNTRDSKFRLHLIEEAKNTLNQFTEEFENTGTTDLDKSDNEFKYKKRLFGNLKFIAELFKKKLVVKTVPLYVLRLLLGMEADTKCNDFTIEGACTFICKVGARLEKLTNKSSTGDNPAEEEKGDSENVFTKVINRIEELGQSETVDQRIRFIIKNTIEVKEMGWVDKDEQEGPKTKKKIKQEFVSEMNGEDNKSSRKSISKSKKDVGKIALNLNKMESTTSMLSEVTEDLEEYNKHPTKEYSPREQVHMDHEAVKDKLIGNFSEWLNTNKLDSSVFVEESKYLSGGTLINYMLMKLFDKEQEEITKFNEFFMQLQNAKLKSKGSGDNGSSGQLFGKKEIEEGISSFFLIIPNIESDYPRLPDQFSELLYFIFIDKNIADFSKVEIKLESDEELEDGEDPIYMVDIYIKILAVLFTKIEDRLGESKMHQLYEHYGIESTIEILKPHLMGDYIDDEVKISETVLKLLNVDE